MAKAKTKAKAKAKVKANTGLQLPKTPQYSEVVEVFEYTDKKGRDKEIYTMALDGDTTPSQLFKLFERPDFKLELGDTCLPVISVVPSAYFDSHGQPKPQNISVVNWVKSDGEVEEEPEEEAEEEEQQP